MLEKRLTIDELLVSDAFRKRPGMYMGEGTISALNFFIAGIFHSIVNFELDPEFSRDLWLQHDFSNWVAQHFGWRECTAGWKNIILEENSGDEEKALDVFFELYDKFHSEKKHL